MNRQILSSLVLGLSSLASATGTPTAEYDSFTCSLTPYDHGWPSAHVSFSPTVEKLDNGLYEATIYFEGDDCSQFDGASEFKHIGVSPTVVI